MLNKLELKNIGPIPDFCIQPGSRLNVITGDNGLGKSFILDVIWFLLTRCWPATVNRHLTSGYMARPVVPGKSAQITFELTGQSGKKICNTLEFDYKLQNWKIPQARPPIPGVVIYAHIDGSFSVWDPNKNYWTRKQEDQTEVDTPAAFVFSTHEVWYGLNSDDNRIRFCNGLLQDLYDWQKDKDWKIDIFNQLLLLLSPPEFSLRLGTPIKLSVKDARKVPTIAMPYGEVSILVAAAGIKRILALAYFLTWTMVEHKENSHLLGKKTSQQITFIMDEIEAHLHPKWQRKIVGGLMNMFKPELMAAMDSTPAIQLILATHSPLIMSSLEPFFSAQTDKWFDINMKNGKNTIAEEPFIKYGNADQWLTSEAFDLSSSRSIAAEEAIKNYEHLMETNVSPEELKKSITELEMSLPDTDPFWRLVDFESNRLNQ